jgi:uncharacterized repeat protein (TIGR03803 family)
MDIFYWGTKALGIGILSAAVTALGLFARTMATAPRAQSGTSSPAAPAFTVLHSFNYTDGAYPSAGLVQGTGGKLYGTTFGGGHGEKGEGIGYGTVFSITPGGKLTTLYLFCSQTKCTDGELPDAGLIQGADGKFYGTTSNGGSGDGNDNGTVFSITAGGKLTTLYGFCSQSGCTDGSVPEAGLVQGADGHFYGTTEYGGTGFNGLGGTVFGITPGGTLTTLYSFCSQGGDECTDGYYPTAGLALGNNGKFYGTTNEGGIYNAGTAFSITPGGVLTTIHSFCTQNDCTDGKYPQAALVQGTDGSFYGTDDNTVFKITPSGNLTTLYQFCPPNSKYNGPCPAGSEPVAGLVQGADGNFYGTTEYGGINGFNGDNCTNGCGTIFKITPQGKLTTLYYFCSQRECADGGLPVAGLVQDTNGTFYGTAEGGVNGYGIVFSLSVGLGPFVETNPTSGKVGKAVKILGSDLTGTTSVTFNGTVATFAVKSKSEITTTVPTGATTGTVQVVTPGGTL